MDHIQHLQAVCRATMSEGPEVIREFGGVKKFKNLAEIISATEADGVPY